jgi:hypothetical protein
VLTFAALVALSGIVAALPPTATAVSLAPDVGRYLLSSAPPECSLVQQ